MVTSITTDLRVVRRSLRATPAVTAAAVLILAIGIGATSAIFSAANGLMLRPLPVTAPDRLVTISSETALRFGFRGGGGWSYSMWDRLRPRADAFDGAFAWTLDRVDLSDGGEMRPLNGLFATGGFFTTLGIHAVRGRTFTTDDDVRGGGPEGAVGVISYEMWQRRFAGADSAVGSRLPIDGTPVTIIGVAPKGFRGIDVGQPFDVAMPFGTEAIVRGGRSLVGNERALLLTAMLRLKSEQTLSQATAALRALQPVIVGDRAPRLLSEPFFLVSAATGISDRTQLRQRYQRPLVTLGIVSGLMLVIACVNVASLLLARASARRRELSVRVAVGAPSWRLARQFILEAVALGVSGAIAGVLVAGWTSRALVTQLPAAGQAARLDLPLDWRVLAFTVGVTFFVVVVVAAAPALYAARVPPLEALQREGRTDAGSRSGLLSSGLIVAQIAVSLVLVAAAGLFARTLHRLVNVPLGFDPANVLVLTVNTAQASRDLPSRIRLFDRIREAVAAVPGVTHAAGSAWVPVGTGAGGIVADAGTRTGAPRRASFNVVTPGWFATYGTEILTGRDFEPGDAAGAGPVALVNASFARSLMGGRRAVGQVIDAGPCHGCTVVGVVADTVYGRSLRDAPPPTVYVPLAQAADLPPDAPSRLSVRIAGDVLHVAPGIAAAIRRIDPRLAYTVRLLETDIDATVAQERLVARLAGMFGVIALLLSAIGLYGVASQAVTRRRGEIAIRLSLGGRPGAVVTRLLARLARVVLLGLAIGVGTAAWLSRFVAPLLYGVEPRDPATLAAATVTLAAIAALAGWFPAARAARLRPADVLREL
jgi:predicted permease